MRTGRLTVREVAFVPWEVAGQPGLVGVRALPDGTPQLAVPELPSTGAEPVRVLTLSEPIRTFDLRSPGLIFDAVVLAGGEAIVFELAELGGSEFRVRAVRPDGSTSWELGRVSEISPDARRPTSTLTAPQGLASMPDTSFGPRHRQPDTPARLPVAAARRGCVHLAASRRGRALHRPYL